MFCVRGAIRFLLMFLLCAAHLPWPIAQRQLFSVPAWAERASTNEQKDGEEVETVAKASSTPEAIAVSLQSQSNRSRIRPKDKKQFSNWQWSFGGVCWASLWLLLHNFLFAHKEFRGALLAIFSATTSRFQQRNDAKNQSAHHNLVKLISALFFSLLALILIQLPSTWRRKKNKARSGWSHTSRA